jgi:hypothetical protein
VQLCTAPPRDLIFPGQQVPYRISQTETETRPRAAQLATRSRNKNTGGRWGRIRGLGVTGGGGRSRLLRGAPHGGAKGSFLSPRFFPPRGFGRSQVLLPSRPRRSLSFLVARPRVRCRQERIRPMCGSGSIHGPPRSVFLSSCLLLQQRVLFLTRFISETNKIKHAAK